MERVDAPLGCGVEVGPDGGEVGESLEGSPAAAGGALLDFDRAYGSFRCVIGEWDGQVSGEPQDHVFVAAEPGDQCSGLVGQRPAGVLVVGTPAGQRPVVEAEDPGQDGLVEVVCAAGAGLGGGVVGLDEGVGHRGGPQLPVGVGVGD